MRLLKSKHTAKILRIGTMLLFCFAMQGQATYNMQDLTVDDCEGILLHSQAGEEGNYDHNENFTFTICIPGATEIILAFDYFATEQNYDIMTIYDGPNRQSPIIATLSGIRQPPPTYVATSGCVTIHFQSDDNISANGWRIRWRTEITAPVIPSLSVVSMLECPLNQAEFRFSSSIPCDQIVPGNFTLLGPGGAAIGSIQVLDCNQQMATRFRVLFTPPLASPASFRLIFNGTLFDACGNEHPVNTNVLFQISNCPITVEIRLPNGSACAGLCANMEAVAQGDNPQNFTYQWSPGAASTRVISVCSSVPVVYTVMVTDAGTGRTATATFNYVPLENPVILNPIQDTVCASAGNRTLQNSMPGGDYFSGSIPDHHRKSGVYEFWRWGNGTNMHIDTVTYIAPNGCRVRDTVHILPINAGSVQASCLNAPDFQMNGGTPAGGMWSGPHLSPAGIFNPVANGDFWATYTAPNGCTSRKRVHVFDSIQMPVKDTLCTTEVYFLEARPPGGRWTGPGVVNSVNGRLEAWRAAPNRLHTYTYTANGCVKTMQIYINELWAGPDLVQCASDSLVQMPWPGDWSGPGVYLPAENAFDISQLGPGEYRFKLTQSICEDDFLLTLIETQIASVQSSAICLEDQGYDLADYLQWGPDGGALSGNGVYWDGSTWRFNPILTGPGAHMVYYEALNCRDSAQIIVDEPASFPVFLFCERNSPLVLSASPSGGRWSGMGFLDADLGLFDPQQAGIGIHTISYTAPNGCTTETTVTVGPYEQVNISGLQQQYCFDSNDYPINLSPVGGVFTINGVPSPPQIRPSALGSGTFELQYTRGTGECSSSIRRFIQVLPPITKAVASVSDSICAGQQTTIFYEAEGGAGSLRYEWDQGLGFGNSHLVNPDQSTWYRITVTDQCSDPLSDSVYIHVFAPFSVNVTTGPEVCYGNQTYAEVLLDTSMYQILWLSSPPTNQSRYDGLPGIYTVEIMEKASGCLQRETVRLPGAAPIAANFRITPNQPCIDIIDNEIEIIDLAIGYTEGYIDFGDGSPQISLATSGILKHVYQDTGTFMIKLEVWNELGCSDSISLTVCVRNMVRVFVPDAFTPNEDGRNDGFRFWTFGTKNEKWRIYNRYGALIYQSELANDIWDGTFKGKTLNPDVFFFYLEYEDKESGEAGYVQKEIYLMK
jgi:gliding motility-associated-like protein